MAQLRLPFLNTALRSRLEFFLHCGKLCLPVSQFPAGQIIGKLLLGHHQTARCCIQTALHRALTALFQLGQRPQKLCTIWHG